MFVLRESGSGASGGYGTVLIVPLEDLPAWCLDHLGGEPAGMLGWLALLGTEERYDDPLGTALDALWVKRGDAGGAWERRPSDPEAIAATGLFGTSACLADRQQTILPPGDVIGLESTRATFLSWPHDIQRHFTGELRQLLESQSVVHLTRCTSVTMAQVLGDRS